MIWYLLKKLLIVLSNTWTFLSLFLANSLFGIAALKKKRAKHTPRVSQASGNPRRYLKRGRAFRLAAFQRNFASTRSTKVYAFRFVQENLFIFFFRKRRDASKYSFDWRITLRIGEVWCRKKAGFSTNFELSRVQYLLVEKKMLYRSVFRQINNEFKIENLGPGLCYCFVSIWMEGRSINHKYVFYIAPCRFCCKLCIDRKFWLRFIVDFAE